MNLENSLNKIKEYLLDKYKDNLAGALVLGSANTKHYLEGESDINTMVFVKEKGDLDFKDEIEKLTKELKDYKFQSQYFHSVDSIKEYLQKRKSFASYLVITADDGSIVLYDTPEFKEMKKWLRENPFSNEEIKEHVLEKDEFEIRGYMKEKSEEQFRGRNYRQTQNLLFHLRRKVQIMNYIDTKKLIFDLSDCLDNILLPLENKLGIYKLYEKYRKREILTKEQIQDYFNLAKELTNKIENM